MKKQVVKSVKWTTASTIILTLTAILKISVLTRFLDKADFGLMAIMLFVLGIVELFNDMGLTTAIISRSNITKKEYASLYWVNWMLSFAMYLVILLLTPLVASFYDQPELRYLLPLVAVNLVISAIGKQYKTIEQKNLSFKYISIVEIVIALISLGIAIFLSMNGFGIYALVYSLIFQLLVSNLLFLLNGLKKHGLLFHLNFTEVKPFFRIGIYQVGAQFINYFNRDMDILVVGKLFGAEILGGYSLARDLVRKPIAIIVPIVNKVGAPLLSKVSGNLEQLKAHFLGMTKILSAASLLMYGFIAVFAYFIVTILYGEAYTDIVLIVQIMCVNIFFRIVGGGVGNLVVATGKTNLDFRWNLMTLFVTPLCVYIGSLHSIELVAMMLSLSMIVLMIPSYYFLIRRMLPNITLSEYIRAYFTFDLRQILKKIK